MSFLASVTKGRHDLHSEDRLSEVFAGCFNHSKYLRKSFGDFLQIQNATELRAQTQVSSDTVAGRYDVILSDSNDKPVVVIENKIEADFGNGQLKKYEQDTGYRNSHKVALVKYLPVERRPAWQFRRWSELHGHLVNKSRSVKNETVDGFVFHEFMAFLKGLGMERVSFVSKQEMEDLGKFLSITSNPNPSGWISLSKAPAFDIGAKYLSMTEEIVDLTRVDPSLKKIIGKNFRFTPFLAKWWEDAEELDPAKSLNWIGIEIGLTRSRKGISHVGTGAFFGGSSGKVLIQAYSRAGDKAWKNQKQLKFKNTGITIEEHAAQTLSFWRKEFGI